MVRIIELEFESASLFEVLSGRYLIEEGCQARCWGATSSISTTSSTLPLPNNLSIITTFTVAIIKY
jgi:hypothetical protein